MMGLQISGFRITGLHGRQDVNIEVNDNAVVLVGVNGLGKTTIVNILYYFLTRQWVRLLDYRFDTVEVDINNQTIRLSREHIEAGQVPSRLRLYLGSRVSPQVLRRVEEDPRFWNTLLSASENPVLLRRLADDLRVPSNFLMRVRDLLSDEPIQKELFDGSPLKTQEDLLQNLLRSQVLYLPTYRRIERDLETLFPGLEEEIHKRWRDRHSTEAYIEFVEFGMRDVERRFDELFANLKERARSELNSLAASYLREVIRGEADTYDTSLINSLDEETVTRILNRVEEKGMLGERDKQTLREVIGRLKDVERQNVAPRDRYVGHFFSKLADIHKSLTQAETSVSAFVGVCNRYLEGKKIVFDDKAYAVYVEQESNGEKLGMRYLSSGEKQVVSLFTHVYLSEGIGLVILIDEPELSLSVPWQKQLLPDIRNSKRCDFLAAVTHSPFIFDNALRDHTTDLRQCIHDR